MSSTAPSASRRRATKGRQTRSVILSAAIEQAATHGLEGLTIGSLAERTGMSKSGLFAHFGSREELQLAVLSAYEERFVASVLLPALPTPRGLARLRRIFELWLARTTDTSDAGCILMSATSEYDDRPGPLRDALVEMVTRWQEELARAIRQAIDTGELAAQLDAAGFIFDLYGIMLAVHHDARLLHSENSAARATTAFERLVAFSRPDAPVIGVTSESNNGVIHAS